MSSDSLKLMFLFWLLFNHEARKKKNKLESWGTDIDKTLKGYYSGVFKLCTSSPRILIITSRGRTGQGTD